MAELDTAQARLARVRAQLKRALVALRERLVAIYETGSPDLITSSSAPTTSTTWSTAPNT